jgi:hypothetical protein
LKSSRVEAVDNFLCGIAWRRIHTKILTQSRKDAKAQG